MSLGQAWGWVSPAQPCRSPLLGRDLAAGRAPAGGCSTAGPSTGCKAAVRLCTCIVLEIWCLMLLPITNFSQLKRKEMYLRSVRELTDSHLQQNSSCSPRSRSRHQLTWYQGDLGALFPWSHCFLSLTCSDYAKTNCSCSLSTTAWP